jgi:hypothetical protein
MILPPGKAYSSKTTELTDPKYGDNNVKVKKGKVVTVLN